MPQKEMKTGAELDLQARIDREGIISETGGN